MLYKKYIIYKKQKSEDFNYLDNIYEKYKMFQNKLINNEYKDKNIKIKK